MKRLMIAAMESNAGKTVVTTGLMRAFQKKGMKVAGFKCGPDYIDTMFHRRISDCPSRNLDLFLQGEAAVLQTLQRQQADIAVIEGVMGFYDGVKGSVRASSWDVARCTKTPVILILRPKGTSVTLAAQVKGLLQFQEPSMITGLLLNDCKPSMAAHIKPLLERETGLPVFGFLPPMEEAILPSRHLGLVTADEIADLTARFERIADALAERTDMDALFEVTGDATEESQHPEKQQEAGFETESDNKGRTTCRIAIARDEAFSFYYEDSFDALREAGAELVFFSPLHDETLPDADALYLGGGYPELFLKELSANEGMRESVRVAVQSGVPVVAECGGFLYLQKEMRDAEGTAYPLADVLSGSGFDTDRLQRFGYKTLYPDRDSLLFRAGEEIPAHEFHYYDCTEEGMMTDTMYAAFPHLHFGGTLPLARRLVKAATEYRLSSMNSATGKEHESG